MSSSSQVRRQASPVALEKMVPSLGAAWLLCRNGLNSGLGMAAIFWRRERLECGDPDGRKAGNGKTGLPTIGKSSTLAELVLNLRHLADVAGAEGLKPAFHLLIANAKIPANRMHFCNNHEHGIRQIMPFLTTAHGCRA